MRPPPLLLMAASAEALRLPEDCSKEMSIVVVVVEVAAVVEVVAVPEKTSLSKSLRLSVKDIFEWWWLWLWYCW